MIILVALKLCVRNGNAIEALGACRVMIMTFKLVRSNMIVAASRSEARMYGGVRGGIVSWPFAVTWR
jgi:hypothetical protein